MRAPSRPRAPSAQSAISDDVQLSARSIQDAKAALLGATYAFHRNPNRPGGSDHAASGHGLTVGGHGSRAAMSGATQRDAFAQRTARSVSRSSQLPATSLSAGIADGRRRNEASVQELGNSPVRPPLQRSPSQQAAMMAAAKEHPAGSTGITGHNTGEATDGTQTPGTRSVHVKTSADTADLTRDSRATDLSSIAPTTSLVDLFERKSNAAAGKGSRHPAPIAVMSTPELVIHSPKPLRSADGITSMLHMRVSEPRSNEPLALKEPRRGPSASREPGHPARTSALAPTDPRPEGRFRAEKRVDSFARQTPSPESGARSSRDLQRWTPSPASRRASSATVNTDAQAPSRPWTSLSQASPQSVSAQSIPAQYHQAYPRKMTPLTTGDDLANALVASSLASSRVPSPLRVEQPPPPPSRRRKHHHHVLGFPRTPSPSKNPPPRTGLLQTLRSTNDGSSSSDEDDRHPYHKHHKKRLVRKHPHKHHEGDRKRWRDALTDRERKRYEGVWAANRGILCASPSSDRGNGEVANAAVPNPARIVTSITAAQAGRRDSDEDGGIKHADVSNGAQSCAGTGTLPSANTASAKPLADQVSNVVAREIWGRSRLPTDVLAAVWDLVDETSAGRLSKEQFVVGMWLIDQRLKGRKLPVKVSDSVWDSVSGLPGIKLRRK